MSIIFPISEGRIPYCVRAANDAGKKYRRQHEAVLHYRYLRSGAPDFNKAFIDSQENIHDGRIELRAGTVHDLFHRKVVRERSPVGTLGCHGVVGIGDSHDAGPDRYGILCQRIGVPLAVVMFVVG